MPGNFKEAGQGAESRTELCKRADAGKAAVNRILKKYSVYGVETVYQCSHGKRRNHLDEIGEELEMYFDENPPESVPDAVQKIKEHFGVMITETPVRIWLKKKYRYRKSKSIPGKANLKTPRAVFPEQYPASIAGYGSKWTSEGGARWDGVHLIYGYTGGYSWCKERLHVPSSYGRKRVNLPWLSGCCHTEDREGDERKIS